MAEIQTQRVYRSLHGSPMLGGLPILGTLSLLGVLILGTFTVKAIGGFLYALPFAVATLAVWGAASSIYSQDRTVLPLFLVKLSTRFSTRVDSYAPSHQDWKIEE